MNFREAVDQVLSAQGIDVSLEDASLWVNEKHQEAVARTRWRKAVISLGNTVADQGAYSLGENVVDILALKVGSAPYLREGASTVFNTTDDPIDNLFSATATAYGTTEINLSPAPDESGDEITAWVAISPPDLSGASPFWIPVEFHRGIVDGALATAWALTEDAPDMATFYDQRFEKMIDLLARRANSRIGSGPYRVKMAGVDF